MKQLLVVIGFLALAPLARAADFPVVAVETNRGTFDIELNDEKAPLTVANFLRYVDERFYDDTIFHRVIKNFVVQGGGHTADMTEKPTHDPIFNEAKNGLSNLKGTIGMARTDEINSATAQFYINTKDNLGLDHRDDSRYGYAVFGKVIRGYEVVEDIENAQTHSVGDYEDVPVDAVFIQSLRRVISPN